MKTILRNFLSVLRRFKMATTLNITGLSIAFAAFMVILMQLDYDHNFDRFHANADRIYRVEIIFGDRKQAVLGRPMAEAFILSSPHIQSGAITGPGVEDLFFTVDKDGTRNSYKEKALKVAPDYTQVFTFDMTDGSERSIENPNTVLIPQSLSQKMFGNEPAVGRLLVAEKTTYTVGGVYRDFPRNSSVGNQIYYPMAKEENAGKWWNQNYNCFIRLDAPANSDGIVDNFMRNFDISVLGSDFSWEGTGCSFRLVPLPDVHYVTNVSYDRAPKSSKQTLLVLLGTAIIIVVIAGINFTNFSTALTPMRIKSINTQKVLGGEESVIRFSLLAEAVCISLVAFLLSIGMVFLVRYTPLPSIVHAEISPLAHPLITSGTALLALFTGLLAGLYPSRYITSFPTALVLKGSFGLSPKGRQLRNVLIGFQFVASFALIIGASFMYLQNRYMQYAPVGYDKEQLIVSDMNLKLNNNRETFAQQLKSFPEIEQVAFAEALLSSRDRYSGWGRYFRDQQIQFQCLPVDANFLPLMGISVTEGRGFLEDDKRTARGAFVFNQTARSLYEIQLNDMIDSSSVVGFMPDIKFASFRTEVLPMAFYIYGENGSTRPALYAYIKVKAGANPFTAMEKLQATLRSIDADYPFDTRFFDEVLHQVYEQEQSLGFLITLFSLIAILISIVGVFGLVVFESEYRRKEIGIRKILGSTTEEILILFNKTYVRILCICFVLAAPVAWYAIVRWLENFAYKTPMYWWVFLLAFAVISFITLLTVTFQNWWTANENPVKSIKTE